MTRFKRIGRRAVTVFLDALFFLVLFGLVTGDEFSEMWEDHAQWYLRNKRTASEAGQCIKYGSFMGEAGSIGRGRGLP